MNLFFCSVVAPVKLLSNEVSLFLSSRLTIHVSVVKVRQQISTWQKFLFSMRKVQLNCLRHCLCVVNYN